MQQKISAYFNLTQFFLFMFRFCHLIHSAWGIALTLNIAKPIKTKSSWIETESFSCFPLHTLWRRLSSWSIINAQTKEKRRKNCFSHEFNYVTWSIDRCEYDRFTFYEWAKFYVDQLKIRIEISLRIFISFQRQRPQLRDLINSKIVIWFAKKSRGWNGAILFDSNWRVIFCCTAWSDDDCNLNWLKRVRICLSR